LHWKQRLLSMKKMDVSALKSDSGSSSHLLFEIAVGEFSNSRNV